MNGDKAVGIITERDFVNLVKAGEASSKWLIVDDLMPEKLITVTPSTSSSKAFALINSYNIKRLPVLQKGKLKGLLTVRQIMVFSRNTLIDAQEKNRSLQREANTDELTGAYNKRFLLRRLTEEYKKVINYGIHSSIIFLDIDHFKKINDTYSHVVGDDVLKALGKIIRAHLKDTDVFARYGGEEFVVLTPFTRFPKGDNLANKIRVAVQKHAFKSRKHTLKVTISAGVASLPTANSGLQALERSDKALYHAKQTGRNKVCHFQTSTNSIIDMPYKARS
jgi:diguanylate cyclase (GGDEF)-like protein